jgi:DNA (cytosine-5)-methyltransferase 1
MKYVSTFAGIGGFDLAFNRAGWTCEAMVEWDANCQKVLRQHFPTVPLKGDIADVTGSQIGKPDLAVGGFPCQDTSIAAPHRAGLAGKRSSNYFEFQRLVGEHLRLVDTTRPRWVVIENPLGLLTSPGRGKDGTDRTGWDMAAVVRGLEDIGYGWAYRVVDARYLGSPQRRKRVLVVGHLGGDPRPARLVLGDSGEREQAGASHQVGGVKRGPTPVVEPLGDSAGPLVFRKSARPRAALSKGGYETWVAEGFANTLTGYDGGGPARQTHLVVQEGRPARTLTLTEWERLQGFPDDWTRAIADSKRYTALGNAMHVGTASWLANRITAVSTQLPLLRMAS